MALLADKISTSVANGLNIFIALMLFLVMPVIFTLAYKHNQRMNAASENEKPAKNEPAQIEAQPEAQPEEPEAEEDAPKENE